MMSKFVLIVAATVLTVSTAGEASQMIPEHLDFRSDEFVDYINNELKTTWKAKRNVGPETSIESVKARLGVLAKPKTTTLSLLIRSGEIPEQFDSREHWPKCQTIKQVHDQGSCGSGWAFGTAEVISDRICIASNQTLVDVEISAENLMDCCYSGKYGCSNGSPEDAWKYYVETGIVTGGRYGTNKTCQPYSIPECDHFKNGKRPPCAPTSLKTPECKHECTISSYPKSYKDDLHRGKSAYSVGKTVKEIQTEIMTHGPVTASFMVYLDFMQYQSGVYRHHCRNRLGSHSVKMIGWGVEDGIPYWLLVNSWNEEWGDKGFFKILRGSNECGIEHEIVAGLPRL